MNWECRCRVQLIDLRSLAAGLDGNATASREVAGDGCRGALAAVGPVSAGASGSGSFAGGPDNPVVAKDATMCWAPDGPPTTADRVVGPNTGGCKRCSGGGGPSSTTRGRKKQKLEQVCTRTKASLQHACMHAATSQLLMCPTFDEFRYCC